jgi:hypothetical protein
MSEQLQEDTLRLVNENLRRALEKIRDGYRDYDLSIYSHTQIHQLAKEAIVQAEPEPSHGGTS